MATAAAPSKLPTHTFGWFGPKGGGIYPPSDPRSQFKNPPPMGMGGGGEPSPAPNPPPATGVESVGSPGGYGGAVLVPIPSDAATSSSSGKGNAGLLIALALLGAVGLAAFAAHKGRRHASGAVSHNTPSMRGAQRHGRGVPRWVLIGGAVALAVAAMIAWRRRSAQAASAAVAPQAIPFSPIPASFGYTNPSPTAASGIIGAGADPQLVALAKEAQDQVIRNTQMFAELAQSLLAPRSVTVRGGSGTYHPWEPTQHPPEGDPTGSPGERNILIYTGQPNPQPSWGGWGGWPIGTRVEARKFSPTTPGGGSDTRWVPV